MSRRDGKMYLVHRLRKEAELSNGMTISLEHDDCAGHVPVYWTKTAARRDYGRNVAMTELRLEDDHAD